MAQKTKKMQSKEEGWICRVCNKVMINPSHEELLFHEQEKCQWKIRKLR